MKQHIKHKLNKASASTKRIQLSSGRLRKVPVEVEELTELLYLDLFGNSLGDLPDWFYKLEQLTNLSLKRNKFTEIPTIIYALNNLKKISISENKMVLGLLKWV